MSRRSLPSNWRGGIEVKGAAVRKGKRWYAVIYQGVDPETGKRRQKWVSGFDTKRDAEGYLAAVASSPTFGSGVGPRGSQRLRLGDFLDRYLVTEARKTCRPKELRRRQQIVNLHLKPRLSHIPLVKIAPATVEDFFSRTDSPSACHWFKVLRVALNHAVRLGLIMGNPCDAVTGPRPRRFRPVMWDAAEILRFLAATRDAYPNHAFWLTEITTGLRLGEMLGLTWRNVDTGRGAIQIVQELDRPEGGGFRFDDPKTESSVRPVRLPPEVVEELRALRRSQVETKLRSGPCPKEDCRDQHCPRWHDLDLVFCQPNGKPLHGHNLTQREMRRLAKKAGVPWIRFYDLRHCHATLLAEEGVNLKEIKERMGHSSEAFTLSRYVHSTPVMQEQAVAAVSRRLFAKEG